MLTNRISSIFPDLLIRLAPPYRILFAQNGHRRARPLFPVASGFPKVVKAPGRGANDMRFVTACEKQFPIILTANGSRKIGMPARPRSPLNTRRAWRLSSFRARADGGYCFLHDQNQPGSNDFSGKLKLKLEPLPTSLSTQIFPPCSSTNFLAKVNPSPVPSFL